MSDSNAAPVAAKPALSNRQALLAAAVEGTLTVQPQPANPKAGGRGVGKVTGLPVGLAWAFQFAKNEKRPAAEKLSDDQLLGEMLKDFPESESACFRRVTFTRAYYNAGKSTEGKKPKVQSTPKASPEAAKPAAPAPKPEAAKPPTPAPAKPAAGKPVKMSPALIAARAARKAASEKAATAA